MSKPTTAEVEAFIQEMKKGKTITLAGEYDPDPYGGGANWSCEMYYNLETHTFVFQTNFYPSQYHNIPEIFYQELDEQKAIERLLSENKYKISCY